MVTRSIPGADPAVDRPSDPAVDRPSDPAVDRPSDPAVDRPSVRSLAARAPVVLYDGLCGLCDVYVQFILRHDHRGRLRFAPLQGSFAARTIHRQGMPPGDALGSVLLVEFPEQPSERVRTRSDAVLAIFWELGGAWRLIALLKLIPRPVRDAAYRAVARVRYRLFGRREACRVPAPGPAKDRFLD